MNLQAEVIATNHDDIILLKQFCYQPQAAKKFAQVGKIFGHNCSPETTEKCEWWVGFLRGYLLTFGA